MILLETQRLYLRNVMPCDVDIMFDYRNNEICSRYQRGQTKTYEGIVELVQRRKDDKISIENPFMLTVALKCSNEMIGEIVVMPNENTFSLGYTFSYKYHRQGYAFEALTVLIEFLHENYTDWEFISFTDPDNRASMGLLTKLGYKDLGYIPSKESQAFGKWITENTEKEIALLILEQREKIINRDKKAVIFDMDGVIFNSERAVYEGWLELAEKYHFADLDEVYIKCIGVNSKITRGIFLEHYGEDFPYDAYKAEQSGNYHARYDGGRLPMKPGIKELLTALREDGYKTAIASSTRTALVEQQIKDAGLREYFDVIVGGDMVERSKPEPDIFLKAAELLAVSPKETYVIEDSYNGIRAAYTGGMIPIMVPDMLWPDDEMKEKASYICKDLYEVKKKLT